MGWKGEREKIIEKIENKIPSCYVLENLAILCEADITGNRNLSILNNQVWRFSLEELKTTKHWYEDEGKWSYVVKLNIQLSYWGVNKCVM